MSKQSLTLNALITLQAFETYWAYFSQSNGLLYDEECRQAAKEFTQCFKALIKVDKASLSVKPYSGGTYKEKPLEIRAFANYVENWANGDARPKSSSIVVVRQSLSHFSDALKTLWVKELGASICPLIKWSSVEIEHMEHVSRWQGYLPNIVLKQIDDSLNLLEKASKSPTIAVIGDIRKSQELMTYAENATSFSEQIVVFIDKTQELVLHYGGIFDKFTGDGFVAFFNEEICRLAGKDYFDAFFAFVRCEMLFCRRHFAQWTKTVRKLPGDEIGLAIGADKGTIMFSDLKNHLIAVGDALVWANRMVSVANANELAINNLLYNHINDNYEIEFVTRTATAKSGENFRARTLSFDEVEDDESYNCVDTFDESDLF